MAGEVTVVGSKPAGDFDFPNSITAGPDGNLWFTTFASRIGRMATSGEVTMFDGSTAGVAFPGHIVAGPDGNLWFTNAGNDSVGRITTSGEITTYAGSPAGVKEPGAITVGPDQSLWFTNVNDRIGRITTAGEIATYALGGRTHGLFALTSGPDGKIWFTSNATNRIGYLLPPAVAAL